MTQDKTTGDVLLPCPIAVDAAVEYPAFSRWWTRTIPAKPVPSSASHHFDAWMASARASHHRTPPLPVHASSTVAWLVEFLPAGDSYEGGVRTGPARDTQYYCGVLADGRRLKTCTTDPNKAMRFSRQQDAVEMIMILNNNDYGPVNAIATEHEWIGLDLAETRTPQEGDAAIARLKAKNAAMRKALEPFAEFADSADKASGNGRISSISDDDTCTARFGMFRAARAALNTENSHADQPGRER